MVKYEKATNAKPLTDVLKQLEDRFTKKIIFSYEELKNYKVKADIKAGSVEEALRQALGGVRYWAREASTFGGTNSYNSLDIVKLLSRRADSEFLYL